MAFDKLKKEFENIRPIYQELLNGIMQQEDIMIAYTSDDFFSLDQFYCEFNNIPRSKVQLYHSPEEFDADNKYLLIIKDRKPLNARQYYDEDIYYDSVFLHTDEESWRYEVYVNGDEVKPIFIEHLYRNERGAAKHYEKYSQYGYQTITYEWENSEAHPCHVEIKYYSLEHELIETRNYQVNYKDDIPQTIVDSEGHEIYSNDNFEKNIEELINEVKGLIIQSVRMTLEKKHSLFKGKIAFALFEYNIQGAFPPTLALASEEEAAAEEDPLCSYNAPDLQYFSERDEYEFDFYHKGTSKYSVLNKHIYEELEPDEGIALARSIYIDLCKSMELQAIFEEYLDLAEDFHITAYDYDAFDLEVMLPLTLDENIWQKLSAKKQAYEDSKTIPEEYLAIIEENTEALQIDPSQWEHLVTTARQASTSFGYLPKKQYFIKPLDYERRFNQPAPYSDFIRLTGASAEPQPDRPIKHYLDQEGRVCLIEYFYQGQVTYEIVYTYEPNRVTEYKKHHNEENLEKKNVLLLKEGKPEHFISYSEHFVRRSTFTLRNDTIAETQNSVLYIDLENKHCSESKSLDRFTYSAEGNLTKVGCYTENGEEIMTYEIEG